MPVNQTRIAVKVQPGAPKNEITGFTGDVLRVRIAAPPERDKANRELIAFLAKRLGIEKGRVSILSGHTSRSKVVAVAGLSGEEVLKRLTV